MKFFVLFFIAVFSSVALAQSSSNSLNVRGVMRTGSGGYVVSGSGNPVITPAAADIRPAGGTSLIFCIDNIPDMLKHAAGGNVPACNNTDLVGRPLTPKK
jgi:hypothetical protein